EPWPLTLSRGQSLAAYHFLGVSSGFNGKTGLPTGSLSLPFRWEPLRPRLPPDRGTGEPLALAPPPGVLIPPSIDGFAAQGYRSVFKPPVHGAVAAAQIFFSPPRRGGQ